MTLFLLPHTLSSISFALSRNVNLMSCPSWYYTDYICVFRQMTAQEYDEVSERDMDTLHDRLEELCEVYAPEDWEVEYSVSHRHPSQPPVRVHRMRMGTTGLHCVICDRRR